MNKKISILLVFVLSSLSVFAEAGLEENTINYNIWDFLSLLGALGVFIYGMKIMSEALQKSAGGSLRRILGSGLQLAAPIPPGTSSRGDNSGRGPSTQWPRLDQQIGAPQFLVLGPLTQRAPLSSSFWPSS